MPRAESAEDLRLESQPPRQLPNLQGFPILILTAEASWKAMEDHGTVEYLAQAGARVEQVRLEERGIHGNGHAMMLELNSDSIAALLAEWIERHDLA